VETERSVDVRTAGGAAGERVIIARRELLRRITAGLAAAAGAPAAFLAGLKPTPYMLQGKPAPFTTSQPTTVRGVTLGVQSYSFRDRALDAAIVAMQQLGLAHCELWQGHVEPRGVSRDEMRKWRETVPLDEFRALKDKFDRAGIRITAYNISFRADYSDAEIERGFEMAQALGSDVITASANTSVTGRVAPVAARRRMMVGMHNHSRIHPEEFATPESFTVAIRADRFIAVNLDIGHFTAANFDAVAFLRDHHDRIVSLHIKDRKRNQGPNMPFGKGDAPIGPVLRLLRDQSWPIPVNIEYEYKGTDTVEEVRRCLEFCRRELES
jgi:sugar phosphate isomerase/epimerase